MTLAETILVALIAFRPNEPAAAERLAPVAAAIAEASEEAPLWDGADGARRTALLLGGIAVHESSLDERVRRCNVLGDAGRARGTYQLLGRWALGGADPDEVCADDRMQARLALRVLSIHRARGVSSEPGLLRAYATGSASRTTKAGRELFETLKAVSKKAPQP